MQRHKVILALLKDRKSRRETRNQQAKRLGVSESTLRSAEIAGRPRHGTLVLLSQGLGL